MPPLVRAWGRFPPSGLIGQNSSAPVVELIASSSGLLGALEAMPLVTVRGPNSCWPLDASVLAEQPAMVSAAMQYATCDEKVDNRIAKSPQGRRVGDYLTTASHETRRIVKERYKKPEVFVQCWPGDENAAVWVQSNAEAGYHEAHHGSRGFGEHPCER